MRFEIELAHADGTPAAKQLTIEPAVLEQGLDILQACLTQLD
ncbi:hypothetical protein [Pseudomonas haemolytica]|nr:hypothetical protein [Pseudomonas haemolytica]